MNIVVRTNLYSERLEQKGAKRPRRMRLELLVLLVVAAYAFWWKTHLELEKIRRDHAAAQSAQTALDQELTAARSKEEERAIVVARRDAVLKVADGNWYCAPLLEHLFAATPANIEISSLQIKAPEPQECTVRISGRGAGEQPRQVCDKCRLLFADALAEIGYKVSATFTKLDESAARIHFEDKSYPAAEFVIELKLSRAVPGGKSGHGVSSPVQPSLTGKATPSSLLPLGSRGCLPTQPQDGVIGESKICPPLIPSESSRLKNATHAYRKS